MHRTMTFLAMSMLLAATVCSAQSEKPEKADVVLKEALRQAEKTNKTVIVLFHASWCGWCKRLEAVLENPGIHKIVDEHFVIAHLDVMERGAKKELENPGGNEMMKEFGGEKSGLPFYVFLDSRGKKLANSNVMPKDQNIGYPGTPEEILAFANLLRQSAPRMTDEQRGQIVSYLQKNAPR